MPTTDDAFESACREHIDRFFVAQTAPVMHERALKALRLLRSSDKPLTGKVEDGRQGSSTPSPQTAARAVACPGC